MTTINTLTPHLHLLFITLLTLSTTSTLAYSRKTTNDLVTTTCKQTPDPILCEASLRSDSRSSKAADSEGLILIMIDVVKTRFSDSFRYVEDLTRKTHDPAVIRALQECKQLYRVVLDVSVGLAVRAVKQGDPKFGEQAMVDAGNEAEGCRMAFPEGKVPGRIVGRTRMLHGVSNVAASMIKSLE
ncbi:cell wall / vacuolar inhibitor of fructosidase 1 [Beta vulgaris subsp. vulgaris]|uniref:cell wall / vacuolar inhibitor of fructosidase 1 n=1 Tax=Beta vulgaris subsp. vulgaris TaxID=3555 RepID=UPI002036B2B5|nr:cell wall / vacuolar inhibitor of fructosidase 1 [Beta vulgaris subsp. vulgaris]